MALKDKNIILCVTGGIAAYKALELTRLLKKEGAVVWPVMSECAKEFITPLSLSALAGNPAASDMFSLREGGINHIEIADKADLLVVVPATANTIGKVASGLADSLLTIVIMACPAPKLVAPAMNHRMYENPVVKENIEKLERLGYTFIGPEEGELACGWEGKGRLSAVEDIVEAIKESLGEKDLAGEKVLVTAGATREGMDPVRFVSNASSGKMGYAIARAARRRGAEVVLISGPSALPPPKGVEFVSVESAEEMHDAAISHFPQSTVVVMAAAVADFSPVETQTRKIKKQGDTMKLELKRTEDILKEMGAKKNGQFLVGFALETENLVENARGKLQDKNLDIVVANGPTGLNSEVNEVTILDSSAGVETLPPLVKDEVAERVLDKVVSLKDG